MGSMAERLSRNFEYVFEKAGWGWHEPLLKSIAGLTAAQAASAPAGRHSVWQIVEHLALWKEYMAGRMAGESRQPTGWARQADWKDIDELTEDAWQAAIQRLVNAQTSVKAELAKRLDDELDQPLSGTDVPLYAIIQGLIAHDSYHCGQIRYIRALQGIPTEP